MKQNDKNTKNETKNCLKINLKETKADFIFFMHSFRFTFGKTFVEYFPFSTTTATITPHFHTYTQIINTVFIFVLAR